MTLKQLKYVSEIVNCGSISEAAKKLYVSQPSLSGAVKELESELGIEIFIRGSRGITLSAEGMEFIGYARQVTEQAELILDRYSKDGRVKKLCCISTQHYAFAVTAFSKMILQADTDRYEFALRETRTEEIIRDVKNLYSEIGIIYMNEYNRKAIQRLLNENELVFHSLFTAKPHAFLSKNHPLAGENSLKLQQLSQYPFLCFDQGEGSSFYMSEEVCPPQFYKKVIKVSDRATLFNLLKGVNGFTVASGVLAGDINSENIASVLIEDCEEINIGWIDNSRTKLSEMGKEYVRILGEIVDDVK